MSNAKYLLNKGNLKLKQAKLLFGFITVLGIIFLTIFSAGFYWSGIGLENAVTLLPFTQNGFCFIMFCLIGGTFYFTVGLCSIEKQYFKNNQNLLVVTGVLVPSLIFSVVFLIWISRLTVGF